MDVNAISNRTIVRILAIIAAFIGAIWLVYLLRTPIIWLFTAFFLALALNPAVELVSKFIPRRNRALSTAIVFILLLTVISGFIYLLAPPLVSQSRQLVEDLPSNLRRVQEGNSFLGQLFARYDIATQLQNSDQVSSITNGLTGSLADFLKTVFSGLVATFTTLILTLFMLIEGPGWANTIWSLVPSKYRSENKRIVERMYKIVTSYVIGNLIIGLIAATAYALLLSILGVPSAIPLALLAGLTVLIPMVGGTIGGIVVVCASLVHSITAGLIVLTYYVVYQQIENNVLVPLIHRKTVEMSPLLIMVSILIGTSIAGILGAFVAIPVGACIQFLIKTQLEANSRKQPAAK